MTIHQLVIGCSETFCENCRPTGEPCPVLVVIDAARALSLFALGCEGAGEYKLCHDMSEAVGLVADAVRALDGGNQ